MAEILPSVSMENDPEAFISLLMQEDAQEGAISNELTLYNRILEKWRDGDIDNEEAIAQAKAVSATRQYNAH